jgi:hypothetical protein
MNADPDTVKQTCVKTFQADQLCILCPWKNDGYALARSIFLITKIVRNQVPIKSLF